MVIRTASYLFLQCHLRNKCLSLFVGSCPSRATRHFRFATRLVFSSQCFIFLDIDKERHTRRINRWRLSIEIGVANNRAIGCGVSSGARRNSKRAWRAAAKRSQARQAGQEHLRRGNHGGRLRSPSFVLLQRPLWASLRESTAMMI